jgi:hypothetical protein
LNANAVAKGRTIAHLLAGAWRTDPPPTEVPETLAEEVSPILLRTAASGLAWWKIRQSALARNPIAEQWKDTFRHQSLRAVIHERNLGTVFRFMHDRGFDPILAKGWSIARLYPRPGLRPYGDIDICVSSNQYDRALAALTGPEAPRITVDLHSRFRELEASYEELRERSKVERIGDTPIRMLNAEDHLRLACIHMLYHGAWRPVWLCDIALMIELATPSFDWNRCFLGDRRQSQWVGAAMLLARDVLGAGIPFDVLQGTPRPPSWFLNAMLEQWGRGLHYMQMETAGEMLDAKEGLWKTLRSRWPNPLQATIRAGAGIDNWPRLPFQIADLFKRSSKFILQKKSR